MICRYDSWKKGGWGREITAEDKGGHEGRLEWGRDERGKAVLGMDDGENSNKHEYEEGPKSMNRKKGKREGEQGVRKRMVGHERGG